jgi:hypothetical protein
MPALDLSAPAWMLVFPILKAGFRACSPELGVAFAVSD